MNMQVLVNPNPVVMVRPTHLNPNPLMKGWKYQSAQVKADAEKPEPIVLPSGKTTSEVTVNSQTHAKIILSRETINQLLDYSRDEWSFTEKSFDDIIQDLLRRHNQRRRHQSRT